VLRFAHVLVPQEGQDLFRGVRKMNLAAVSLFDGMGCAGMAMERAVADFSLKITREHIE
jgi:hypothetical protein